MKQLILISMFLFTYGLYGQKKVNGTVTDTEGGNVPGVTVQVVGTNTGTITNLDGVYEISLFDGQFLSFSFTGFKKQTIEFTGQSTINVVLETDVEQLEEVVVTALGIKQSRKAINYSVQDVKSDQIQQSGQDNIVNALNGKVAGVMVTSTSGSPGTSAQILIRGANSVNEGTNNQPLFIVDGLPIDNSSAFSGGNRAMDINPDDVESVTVLKGSAASALYGIEAANGAVIITTKSGSKGAAKISFNSGMSMQTVFRTPPRQQLFMQGTSGVYSTNTTASSWGPLFNPGMPKYDNIGDYFETGMKQKYDLSISGGTQKSTFLITANYLDHQGIVPGEYYNKMGALIKGSMEVKHNLNVTASSNIVSSENSRSGWGSMYTIYNWPLNNEMSSYLNPDGTKKWLIERSAGNEWNNMENPYWQAENNYIRDKVLRNISQISLDYRPFEFMTLIYRVGTDASLTQYRSVVSPESAGSKESYQGKITDASRFYNKTTSTFNLTFQKTFFKNLDVSLLLGNNIQIENGKTTYVYGSGFKNKDLESINNMETNVTEQYHIRKRVYGFYGDLKLNWNEIVYLGATARNDHSSTLPVSDNSLFYPSFNAGLNLVNLIWANGNPLFTYGKLRATWAQVGKDAPPHKLYPILEPYLAINGGFKYDYLAGNPFLKPETTQEYSLGADLRFFKGITRLDVEYYSQKSIDQIVQSRISVASGWVMMVFNAGSVENKGFEFILEQQIIKNTDFDWQVALNFSKNKSQVVGLPSFVSRLPVTPGQVLGSAKPTSLLNEPLMAIEGVSYLYDENGRLVLDANGYPRTGNYMKDADGNYLYNPNGTRRVDMTEVFLGNREPKAIIGLTNTFRYKGFNLAFMFDFRIGGVVLNATRASMLSSGTDGSLEKYRNREVIFKGVIEQSDGTFVENDKPVVLDQSYFYNYISVGENFVEDASWARLRYINISYDINRKFIERFKIERMQLGFSANNLFLWTPYSGGDPETNYAGAGVGGSGTLGLDYYNNPSVRSFDFNLRIEF